MHHTIHTTHTSHINAPQSRIKVTFSDRTADEDGERPPVSAEQRLIGLIDLKFKQLSGEYAAHKLAQITLDVLTAHHVVKCHTSVYVMSAGGLWLESTPTSVVKLVSELLLKQNLDRCQRFRNKIEHVLLVSKCDTTIRANVLQTLGANQEKLRAELLSVIRNQRFDNIVAQALESVRDNRFSSELDRDQGVIGACGKLFSVSGGTITQITSRDEMARSRVSKQLPFALPSTAGLSASAPPTSLQKLDPALVATLQTLIGNALLANRPAPNTVVHVVGEGAAAFGAAMLSIAGELAVSPQARSLTSRAAAARLRGHRLLVTSTDDGTSAKLVSRAIQKLSKLGDTTILPIVISSNDQSPLTLANNWKVLSVPITNSCQTPPTPAESWCHWLIQGLSSAPTASATEAPATPLHSTLTSQQLTNNVMLTVIEDFVAENGWWPTPSTTTTPQRTPIASVLPAIRAAASKRGMHSVQITQALAAQFLERRKFKVKNHSNKLIVEWHGNL